MQPESNLELAARHIAEGRRIVKRQRARIARLKALGCPIQGAEHTLTVFLSTLAIFEDHERLLRERGRQPTPSPRRPTEGSTAG